jgi:hypothetical protein
MMPGPVTIRDAVKLLLADEIAGRLAILLDAELQVPTLTKTSAATIGDEEPPPG